MMPNKISSSGYSSANMHPLSTAWDIDYDSVGDESKPTIYSGNNRSGAPRFPHRSDTINGRFSKRTGQKMTPNSPSAHLASFKQDELFRE
eukprot:scaffold403_cov113-Cylindrotheca_fusiformis.AAC.3